MRALRARGSARPVAIVCFAWSSFVACADPETLIRSTVVTLQLPGDSTPDCLPPGPVSSLEVAAQGDFAAAEDLVEVIGPGPGSVEIDRFPEATRELFFTARSSPFPDWRAVGVHLLGQRGVERSTVLLPMGRSCRLSDPELVARPGASLAALPNGDLWLLGGEESEGLQATRRTVRLQAGSRLSAVVEDPQAERRQGATATVVGSRLLVAGGAPGPSLDQLPHDSFEVYDTESGRLVRQGLLCANEERECSGRRDHGAGRLPDDRVLLVAGRGVGGVFLRTATLVDPERGEVEQINSTEQSVVPERRDPQVLTLDDGTVLLVGGIGPAGLPVASVHWFDPEARAFADLGLPFPSRPGAVALALPGARMAWVGGASAVQWLTFDEGPPTFELHEVEFGEELPVLDPSHAVALPDGRVLLSGLDSVAERWRAFLLDLSTEAVEEADLSRSPRHLESLADGSVVELDERGASLRRDMARTPFTHPPATITGGDLDWISLDAPARWELTPMGLAARQRAFLYVPTLRFRRFDFVVDLEGRGDLLLRGPSGDLVRVTHRADEVGPALCTLSRDPGQEVQVERASDTLILRRDDGTERRCRITDIGPTVSIGLDLDPGAVFRALRLRRR